VDGQEDVELDGLVVFPKEEMEILQTASKLMA
jgi:hypothetical protein